MPAAWHTGMAVTDVYAAEEGLQRYAEHGILLKSPEMFTFRLSASLSLGAGTASILHTPYLSKPCTYPLKYFRQACYDLNTGGGDAGALQLFAIAPVLEKGTGIGMRRS